MSGPPAKAKAPGRPAGPPLPKAGMRPAGPPPPPPKAGGGPRPAGALPAGPKLKPLHWQGATQAPPASLFVSLRPPAPFSQSFVESQFQQPCNARAAAAAAAAKKPAGGDEAGKRLRILNVNDSQKLAIAFSRLPRPEKLAEVLRTCEDFPEALPTEAVLALRTASREQKEAIAQLQQLHLDLQDMDKIDTPERYLLVLGAVPGAAAKLACGALIVGPATGLPALRNDAKTLSRFCRALRSSGVIERCVSTSLAVGNFINRGTARPGLNALVLPDSLLKLEALQGTQEEASADRPKRQDSRAPSLLDVVVQALVEEAGGVESLYKETSELMSQANAAKCVSLEESEKTSKEISEAASQAFCGISSGAWVVPAAGATGLLAERVRGICRESEDIGAQVVAARAEVQETQKWCMAAASVSGEDWVSSWAAFLKLLKNALARAKPAQPAPSPQPPATTEARAPAAPVAAAGGASVAAPLVRGARRVDSGAHADVSTPPPQDGAGRQGAVSGSQAPAPEPATRVSKDVAPAAKDDNRRVSQRSEKPPRKERDARVEDLDVAALMAAINAPKPAAPPRTEDKENAKQLFGQIL